MDVMSSAVPCSAHVMAVAHFRTLCDTKMLREHNGLPHNLRSIHGEIVQTACTCKVSRLR